MLSLILHLFFIISISTARAITLQCHFHDSNWGYKCTDKRLIITTRDNRTLSKVEGEHGEEKSDESVLAFAAHKNKLFYMPRGLGGFFASLKYLSIKSCGLRELSCGDLEQFGDRLTYLWLCNNDIEWLEKGVFKNNPNLAILNLIGNKLKFVETGAVTELAFPHGLYLQNNPCFSGSISYDEEGIAEFMVEVEEKCTFGNSLSSQVSKAFEKVGNFEKEKNDLREKMRRMAKEIENLKSKVANCEKTFEHSGDHE